MFSNCNITNKYDNKLFIHSFIHSTFDESKEIADEQHQLLYNYVNIMLTTEKGWKIRQNLKLLFHLLEGSRLRLQLLVLLLHVEVLALLVV